MTNDTIAPVQPPRRRRRPRKGIVITAALAAAAGAVLAVGATSHSPAAHPGPARTAHSAPAAPSTPPPSAPAAQAIPGPDVELFTWWYAGGQDEAGAVQSDLAAIGTDAGAQNLIAVEADGSQLVTDAQAALADPPPADAAFAGPYTAALHHMVRAGQDMTAGRFDAATTELLQGTDDINTATAMITSGLGS